MSRLHGPRHEVPNASERPNTVIFAEILQPPELLHSLNSEHTNLNDITGNTFTQLGSRNSYVLLNLPPLSCRIAWPAADPTPGAELLTEFKTNGSNNDTSSNAVIFIVILVLIQTSTPNFGIGSLEHRLNEPRTD